jgi:hypothetical protein
MTDCDDLIDQLHAQARDQAHLAVIAKAASVAEMHIDLALLSEEQARVAEELCEDAERPVPAVRSICARSRNPPLTRRSAINHVSG